MADPQEQDGVLEARFAFLRRGENVLMFVGELHGVSYASHWTVLTLASLVVAVETCQ